MELLSLRKPPTAIFAFNDEMAVGAMRAAEERGLEIPRDLSIVGFDDVEKTQIVTPALTTVRQPLAEMGRMAVSLLTRLLERSADRSDARRARDEADRAGVDGAAARLTAATFRLTRRLAGIYLVWRRVAFVPWPQGC